MTQLRHIHTNASTTFPKCQGQSLMVNLLTFSTIAPEFFTTTKNLKKLKLGPFVKTNGESSLFYSLLQLELLENLKLHNDVVTCKLKALPFEHQFPTQLRKLSLQSTSLDWSHMSTLVKLKWLEVWKAKSSNFPQLNLKHCSNLEVIPSDLANVKSLQLIDLEHTSKSVVNSAKNMQLLQLRVLRQKRDIETSELKLCINNVNALDYISTTPSGKCVRSFLTFSKEKTTVEPIHVPAIPKTFKLLRVQETQSLIFTRFPAELCHLVLLKEKFPETINEAYFVKYSTGMERDVYTWEAGESRGSLVERQCIPKKVVANRKGRNCDKLRAFPHDLADIASLQMVVLHCTNPSVASSARRLQIEHYGDKASNLLVKRDSEAEFAFI
ncbi:hypothetical protein ACH5RR_030236 [Cinchona calisaya]|uniref:Uncharacterized protein n=1 Tax=Cinchona calisaya TaxID=153742 RepID=A0ABD2YXQ7_9GENT